MPIPLVSIDEKPRDQTRWIPREQAKPEEVEFAKDVKPVPPKPVTTDQRSVAPKSSDAVSTPTIVEGGTEVATESTSEATGPAESFDIVEAAPAAMQLQYKLAPAPAYPRRALQQRLTGTVMLQVLVGVDGRPLEVKVAQSSGHRELDEAARAQVFKRWSFQPATRNGQAVQAMGMVPIAFALRN
jgi:protein TonB